VILAVSTPYPPWRGRRGEVAFPNNGVSRASCSNQVIHLGLREPMVVVSRPSPLAPYSGHLHVIVIKCIKTPCVPNVIVSPGLRR